MKEQSWKDFPSLTKLFEKILEHRRLCRYWNTPETPEGSCHDCHIGLLGKIERELNLPSYKPEWEVLENYKTKEEEKKELKSLGLMYRSLHYRPDFLKRDENEKVIK